jgi:hypothetical protein
MPCAPRELPRSQRRCRAAHRSGPTTCQSRRTRQSAPADAPRPLATCPPGPGPARPVRAGCRAAGGSCAPRWRDRLPSAMAAPRASSKSMSPTPSAHRVGSHRARPVPGPAGESGGRHAGHQVTATAPGAPRPRGPRAWRSARPAAAADVRPMPARRGGRSPPPPAEHPCKLFLSGVRHCSAGICLGDLLDLACSSASVSHIRPLTRTTNAAGSERSTIRVGGQHSQRPSPRPPAVPDAGPKWQGPADVRLVRPPPPPPPLPGAQQGGGYGRSSRSAADETVNCKLTVASR